MKTTPRTRLALAVGALSLLVGLVPQANAATVIVKTNLGGHVQVDQFGTYYCFGRKATVVGTNGADKLRLKSNYDVVVALGGDDLIIAWEDLTPGNKYFVPMTTDKDLRLCAGDGNDQVYLGGRVDAGPGDDLVSIYDSEYFGHPYANDFVIYGGPGRDRLEGTTGPGTLYGNAGDDMLSDASFCYGGLGRNTYSDCGNHADTYPLH